MALVICLPMHINAPGFANFNVTEETIESDDCMPPVLEDSKESINSSIYSLLLFCKVLKVFMIKGICFVLQQPRVLHSLRGPRFFAVCHLQQEETIPE